MRTVVALALLVLIGSACADVYLHNPRGSNNRNREKNTNTQNANRLFDSQNNNKGGYAWGPPMTFYEGSLLQIEFTAQHGCGAGHPNVDCDIILQYMCHPLIRDGVTTDTITQANMNNRETNGEYTYGMHEPYSFYEKCKTRIRNKGLFTADQNMGNTASALQTRQDNNENNVHGFECVEERDYYPYWHPSPWKDIVVLTSNLNRCAFFKAESQNVKGKHECSNQTNNNEADCVSPTRGRGAWTFVRGWDLPPPDCLEGLFTRDNHLGNTRTGHAATYSWVIPKLNTMQDGDLNDGGQTANCVFRIRYNMSSSDYNSWGAADTVGAEFVDSDFNGRDKSPVTQNPYVQYGTKNGIPWELRLALNTDQYGRTFEDRSHMFKISKRPANIAEDHRIFNLNVRGKRGNIVETYPAVEYDFCPNELRVNKGDYIHYQWTGSDFNPNYAGEGTQGTDRSNIVQMFDGRKNYPMPFDQQTLFATADKAWEMAYLNQFNGVMCATADQTNCCKTRQQHNNNNQDPQNCAKLNGPVVYFDGGPVRITDEGTYYYMSTRNNNLSNRSQKGIIIVGGVLSAWGVALASIGAAGFAGASALAGLTYYAQTHPQAAISSAFSSCKL